VELLIDLQILGCELQKMRLAAGLYPVPGPAGRAIALPRPPSRYKKRRGGREGEGRVANRERTEGEGREGCEGVGCSTARAPEVSQTTHSSIQLNWLSLVKPRRRRSSYYSKRRPITVA